MRSTANLMPVPDGTNWQGSSTPLPSPNGGRVNPTGATPPPRRGPGSACEATPGAVLLTAPERLSSCKRLKVKQLLQLDLAECGFTRAQVAARMSEVLARPITEPQVDGWVQPNREDRNLSLGWALAWMQATRSARVLRWLQGTAKDVLAPEVFEATDLRAQIAAAQARLEELG